MEVIMIRFLKLVLELFGIVYLRFRPVPRLWCVWLVGVNAACVLLLAHVEAQVVLAVTAVAVTVQTLIYQRIGFTRILGVVHILWLPMFAWMATRAETIASDPSLANWIVLLFATNAISMIVDAVDVIRFFLGEREPHYRWKLADQS
jgi:hypothetical protein